MAPTWLAFLAVGCGPGGVAELDVPPRSEPEATSAVPVEPAPSTPPPSPPTGFPAVAAFDEPGPFASSIEPLDGCTVHVPEPLAPSGLRHPVVLWGNGTATTPIVYAGLLAHLATHGFVVAAADTSNAGDGSEMLACLDALEALDADAGSPWFQALELDAVAASGHSQGGAGALMAALDPRVVATAPIEPYILFIPFGGDFDAASIEAQEAPMFLVSGGEDSLAVPEIHQLPIWEGSPAPVTWALLEPATHFEPVGDGGDFRGPVTAFLRARLMGDLDAALVVDLPSCSLCSEPGWVVR